MAAIITRQDAPWAYLPTLAALTMQKLDAPELYKEVVEIKGPEVSPDKRGVTTAFHTPLGPLQRWGEVLRVPFDSPDPGRLKTTAYQDFGLACAISRNAVEDELYGINDAIGSGLPDSHRLFRDLIIARLLNNFYNTTYFADDTATPVALGSASHGSVQGAVRPNILATSQSLSYQSVIDLLVLGWQHKSEVDQQEPMWGTNEDIVLMVSPADYPMAIKITKSLNDPTNNSNSINLAANMAKFRVVMNPYISSIGSGNYWFLLRAKKGLWLVERRKPEIFNRTDPDNFAMIVGMTCREAVHVENTWGIWGSGN